MSEHPLENQVNIKEVLRQLMDNHQVRSGTKLAKTLNIPAPTVNRILSGQVTDPKASTLTLFADYFQVTIDQLLGKSPLSHTGTSHSEPTDIPLLPLAEAVYFPGLNPEHIDWFKWNTSRNPSKHFAIKVSDDSLSPFFHQNTILIINRELKPSSHDYVAIKTILSNKIQIHKLLIDNHHQHILLPLCAKQSSVTFDPQQHLLLGVVTEAHSKLSTQ